MFTGIVEEVGHVRTLEPAGNGRGVARLTIDARKTMDDTKVGDSISVNGACLTVVHLEDGSFQVELAPETLKRTNLRSLEPGHGVNLERPVEAGGRLGGHVVQGHVDATARVASARPDGDSTLMSFRAPRRLMPYVVEKGFVAVDGISLTVVKKGASNFAICVIPFTMANTVLRDREPGDAVNLEVDIMAKYVESLLRR